MHDCVNEIGHCGGRPSFLVAVTFEELASLNWMKLDGPSDQNPAPLKLVWTDLIRKITPKT